MIHLTNFNFIFFDNYAKEYEAKMKQKKQQAH